MGVLPVIDFLIVFISTVCGLYLALNILGLFQDSREASDE